MNRISGVSSGSAVGGNRAKAATAGGFTVAGSAVEEGPASVQAAPAAGLAGMLALQEAEAALAGNRNGRRHGLAVLEALRDLQQDLLGGMAGQAKPAAGLTRLAELAPAVTDPGLADVLAAIRLRAKIELLRRGR